MNPTPISAYEQSTFTASVKNQYELQHEVYSRGTGPAVILIQELPGIGPETLLLADRLVEQGFQVVLPHLFGPIGKLSMAGNLLRVFCMRREFYLFTSNRSSPIVDWLKALCQHIRTESNRPGVGVIGMCLTGNFAISLMADESVLAAVASQPSLPIIKGTGLHMDSEEVEQVRERLAEHGPMLAFRFEGDKLCTPRRFELIDQTFNSPDQTCVELHTLPGKAHAVLTLDFVDEVGHPTREAMDKVMQYFKDKLGE